jgi:hypothetical protein
MEWQRLKSHGEGNAVFFEKRASGEVKIILNKK